MSSAKKTLALYVYVIFTKKVKYGNSIEQHPCLITIHTYSQDCVTRF